MDSVCDLLASRARGSGATFQPAVMPPSYVPESETIQGPAVDTRGSIPNLEATRGTAGQWSARLQPWIARFNEFKLPAKTASKSDHDARVAALEALLSEWAREADLYQRFVEVAQLVLASAVGNIEILAQRGEQANAMAYAEQQQAQALWNAGDRDGAQLHADALARAVRAADYDLQYLIYLVAVHRQLRHRLGAAYDAERQLGGALYLFLRGMTRDGTRGVHRDRPPVALIEALDRAFDGAGSAP